MKIQIDDALLDVSEDEMTSDLNDLASKQCRNLLEILKKHGKTVPSSCGGHGACGDCKIKVIQGDDHLTPITNIEKSYLGNVYFITKQRLACQCLPTGDISIELSE